MVALSFVFINPQIQQSLEDSKRQKGVTAVWNASRYSKFKLRLTKASRNKHWSIMVKFTLDEANDINFCICSYIQNDDIPWRHLWFNGSLWLFGKRTLLFPQTYFVTKHARSRQSNTQAWQISWSFAMFILKILLVNWIMTETQ